MKKRILVLVLASLIILTTGMQISLAAEKFKVGVSFYTLTNPFFLEIQDAAKKVIEEAGGELVVSSSEVDSTKQVIQIEDMIS